MGVGGDGRKFAVEFSAEGEGNVIAAIRQLAAELKKVEVGGKRAARSGSDLGRSFRNILLRTTAIVGVFRTFRLITTSIRGATRAGIAYNETIETSTLAIASLVTATSNLVDENGDVVSGVEALDLAYTLAEKQVQKLRIAGIQTAATTKELVDAFQQAVGAGLATGLTLDQIRTVTIRIAQAAGALGVPYRQLNEEIRSILGGIIDQNTRIAKALGLTNEQIRLAKEQGRLAEFLLESFEAFGIAGERIVKTWSALKSNVAETLELFAGQATLPLFEALRTRGGVAIAQIFDFDTAEIATEFEGLLDGLQLIFAQVGDLFADAIEGAVQGASDLSEFLEENSELVLGMVSSFDRIIRSTGAIIAQTVAWSNSTGLVSQHMETIADAFEIIADSKALQALIAAGLAAAALGIVAAIFGGTAAVVLAVAAAVGVLVVEIDRAITSQKELIAQETIAIELEGRQATKMADTTRRAAELANELDRLRGVIADTAEGTEEAVIANTLLEEVLKELADISEKYADAIELAGDSHEEVSRLIRAQIGNERILLALRLKSLEAQLAENAAKTEAGNLLVRKPVGPPGVFTRTPALSKGALRALDEQREKIEGAIVELEARLVELDKELKATTVSVVGKAGDEGDGDAFLKELRARSQVALAVIKADLAETEAALRVSLERNLISYRAYFDQLAHARDTAISEQIAVQQELLANETDVGRRATVQARIIQLESRRIVEQKRLELEQEQALEKVEDQVAKARIRLLEATGDAVAATTLKIETEFKDLIARLAQEGRFADIALIENLIDVEVARSEFKKLESVIREGQQRLRDALADIQLEEQIGTIGGEEARIRTAAAYAKLREEIGEVIAELQRLADTSEDPRVRQGALTLIALYNRLGIQIEGLTNDWLRFKKELRTAAEDELASHLSKAVLEAESLGEAFHNLTDVQSILGSIAAAIVEITARMIALKIISASIGAFGGGGEVAAAATGARGGLVRVYAGGGRVFGPGGPTADRIPALLSAGEYVVRARSVHKYGPDFLDRLNRGLVPRGIRSLHAFAGGGHVGPLSRAASGRSGGSGADLKAQLSVALTPGLVLEHMDSPEGDRLMIKIATRNKRRLNKLLGS